MSDKPENKEEMASEPKKITFQCWNCRMEIEGVPSETTTNVFCEICGARQ
jgi:ribosomal protein S27E